MNLDALTDSERKFRTYWMAFALASALYGAGASFFLTVYQFPMPPFMWAAQAFGFAIGMWIACHCVYRKGGTRWLTFLVFFGPLATAFLATGLVPKHYARPELCLFLDALLPFIGLLMNWKMLEINKKLKKAAVIA